MEGTPIPTLLLNADNSLRNQGKQLKNIIHNLKSRRDQNLKRVVTISTCVSKKDSNKELKLRKMKQEIASVEIKIEELQETKQNLLKELKNYRLAIDETKEKSSRVRDDITRLNGQISVMEQEVTNHRLLLKDKQTAFITANGYFKSRLQIYVDLKDPADDTFVVAFFTSEKKEKYDYFIKLCQKDDKWNLVEMKPKLSSHQYLMKNLSDTNDIQGFLCCVRKQFQEHASKNQTAT